MLAWSRGHTCDRPLRFWLVVLIMLQAGTVCLNCINIVNGCDSFNAHRNGLSASDMDMYTDRPAAPPPQSADAPSTPSSDEPLLDETADADQSDGYESSTSSSSSSWVSTEFVDRYVRFVNAWYLIWFIVGSIWVSDGGTCSTTAPHLYRLIVALTIIYYALLFLPLACFCLIVCCLPLFILVYRIVIPIAERERRRRRAADPELVQNLNSIVYSPETFITQTRIDSLDDASCVICLCDYEDGETVRFLPCKHHFHKECVDEWLTLDKACCLCKQDIDAAQSPQVSNVV